MSQPANTYTPIKLQQSMRRQAFKVWIATSSVVVVWVSLIIAAPVFSSAGNSDASSPIYTFFGYICHQIPERSLYLAGYEMAVCSRCFGVYLGLLLGMLAYPLWRQVDEIEPIPRFWLFLSLVPISIDWSLTVFGVWENTHASRLISGLILGFACSTYIVPALVEIIRNLSGRGVRTQ